MTIHQYTNDELRAEAAHRIAAATEDDDFMSICERVDGHIIDSTDDEKPTTCKALGIWAAEGAVYDLIGGSADTSRWAVDLGADRMEPGPQYINVAGGVARLHIAFQPDLSAEQRAQVARNVAAILGEQVAKA